MISAHCIKLTIDGNFAINGNYHGNRAQQLIKIKVSMVDTIDGKVTIHGKFCAKGPRWKLETVIAWKELTNVLFHYQYQESLHMNKRKQ